MTVLIGPAEKVMLADLRARASQHPVEMRGLMDRLKLPKLKAEHKAQMTAQSVVIPWAYMVTFSIETGHPSGTARHMSMSVGRFDRMPLPEAVWMVAEALGFVGSLGQCAVWLEDLEGHGKAINVVQPLSAMPEASA